MVENRSDKPFNIEPKRGTVESLETSVRGLVGEYKLGVRVSPLIPPADTATSEYRRGDIIVSLSHLTGTMPFSNDVITLTEVKTRERKPIITGGKREYPYKTLQIRTEEGIPEVKIQIGTEQYANSDSYPEHINNILTRSREAHVRPGFEADVQGMLQTTQAIDPHDLLDKYGSTQAEQDAETHDIAAIDAQLRKLAVASRQTKIRYPIFVKPEGERVDIRLYKKNAPDDTSVSHTDIFPRAKDVPQRIRNRVTLFRKQTEGFSIEVTEVPKEDTDGNVRTTTKKYTTHEFRNKQGRSVVTNIITDVRTADGGRETIEPTVTARSLHEIRLDETVFDPSQVANVTLGPQGRGDLLNLLKTLDASMIQERYKT